MAQTTTDEGTLRRELKELMEESKRLTAQLEECTAYLEGVGVGMDAPLVDKEGFPLADVDVYTVRHRRQELHRTANDLRAVRSRIDERLQALHSISRVAVARPEDSQSQRNSNGSGQPAPQAFAVVDSVVAGSPAQQDGLCAGDGVVSFGGVQRLDEVPGVVAAHRGQFISVRVLRAGTLVDVNLRPREWDGRGLLGCHMLPWRKS